jgi:hypothetical protein
MQMAALVIGMEVYLVWSGKVATPKKPLGRGQQLFPVLGTEYIQRASCFI